MNRNIVIGGGIATVGIIITLATYSNASAGGSYVVTWGAIVFGGVQFLVGVGEAIARSLRSPEKKQEDEAVAGSRLILQSMIYTAAADGELSEGEVAVIQIVARASIGAEIDRKFVDENYAAIARTGDKVLDEYGFGGANRVAADDARIAVRASAMVAFADGDFDNAEMQRIQKIASKFGLDGELETLIGQGRQQIEKLLQAVPESELA
ncbi:MAG: DUF533 domain-containing protein [Oceanicaulis sp.]